jgi:hypothetical protein
MRSLLLYLVALLAAGILVVSCNTADPSECFPNTGNGFGGSGTIPIGAGVGVSSSGDLFSPPRFGSLGNPPANPCVTGSSTPSTTPVTMLPPICRTDPPRFCAAVCEYPQPMAGQEPVPTLTKQCSEPSAGMLEALFADDVKTTVECVESAFDGVSYVVTPTFFSITPVNVPVVMPGIGVVQCMMPSAPPPTDTLEDWNKQQ